MRILVTGATGVIGSEVINLLREVHKEVIGVSSNGSEAESIVPWMMGHQEIPRTLRRRWDLVIHAAASTQWNMTKTEAYLANVESARALHEVCGAETRLIFLSTSHAIGLSGDNQNEDLRAYRNTYEWSKAWAERLISTEFDHSLILRFPIVIGRRADGQIRRFTAIYKLLRSLASGLIPAVVGERDALLDIIPVDDVAEAIRESIESTWDGRHLLRLGRGDDAPTVERVIDVFFDEIDSKRIERGIPRLDRPPLIGPDKWNRFHLPFAKDHLSPLQLRVIGLFAEFQPYMSIREPFDVDKKVDDVIDPFRRSVRWWAERDPRAAGATPQPWRRW